jgi:hypothetical protein
LVLLSSWFVRKWIGRVVAWAVVCGLLVAAGMSWLYHLSQWQPSFYAPSIPLDRQAAKQAGDQLERSLLAAHNEVVDRRRWQLALADDQVNGWLATVLPEKFPQVLPDFIEDPRVQFRAGQAELACRYQGPKFSAVASLVVEPFLAEQPNVIAVRLRHARLGALPGLKKRLVEQASREARRRGIALQWTQLEGDPVALIPLAVTDTGEQTDLRLEHLELREGQLILTGRAGKQDAPIVAKDPRGG